MYGIVLRDCPKQVVSLAKAKCVATNMREFLSCAQKHYRIDVTTSTVERKTSGPASAGTCPGGCKEFSHTRLARAFRQVNVQDLRYRSEKKNVIRSDKDPATCSHQHTDHRESNAHTRKTYCVDCGTYIDSVPREIFNALEATRSASSNCDEELADRDIVGHDRSRSDKSTLRQ